MAPESAAIAEAQNGLRLVPSITVANFRDTIVPAQRAVVTGVLRFEYWGPAGGDPHGSPLKDLPPRAMVVTAATRELGHVVTGRATSAQTGLPLPNTLVSANPDPCSSNFVSHLGYTDDIGRFTLLLPSGTYLGTMQRFVPGLGEVGQFWEAEDGRCVPSWFQFPLPFVVITGPRSNMNVAFHVDGLPSTAYLQP